ncbi:uncharacterized protein C8orf76-like [Mizuhopecten yessoensis]|uniref:Uncharacterized protein C8orf76 n=1 Tax=Mizuhopecten yessoensis TaxID=6573 RepID=A0A210QAK5_MIZYE|nr:uncharacterized protein C8orf76-like [Mizuhopecten yessoensis]XP_021363082.1 uncharacterized protein C8orf76-like [Mizuhopecten yessoensis]XP_021363083.1 uncharacterized protein C8orf76-like [Mizuhopecten yessoensis]XP_021363084.1 uncharacterized protein C8orf76-like [Mizuhopecten yessoensis]OWF45749.1 Uncharacterized protein C8orf76 [Mizuhopecten yessoensis]
MELGLAFDDEDLEENTKKSKTNQLVSYNAKFCPPKWYEDADINDNDSAAQILKYRGDHSYIKKEYAAAIDHYEEAFGRLPANNKGMRREMKECQTRSYVALQQHKQALELAYQLKDDASTPDQHFQSLVLLTYVQEAAQDWPEFEESVKQLICCHPDSGNLWRRLSQCYWHRQHNQGTPEYYKLLTCLVRSRLVYSSVRRSVGMFVAERNESYLKQIGQQISDLNASDELIQKAKQFLSHDMSKVEQHEGGDNSVQKQMDVKDFDKRWYSWADELLPT